MAGEFSFLREARSLGRPIDWNAAGAPLLWRYNLHYFDWIWSLDLARNDHWAFLRQAIMGWIRGLLPSTAKTAWAPYPTSLRAINWTMAIFQGAKERLAQDLEFQSLLRGSLWRQVTWLGNRLERHLRANHLLENAAALSIVGGHFSGRDADRWRHAGDRLLLTEVNEQFLSDGCHFERSPMYHARALWLMEASLAARSDLAGAPHHLGRVVSQARHALTQLRHPDGEIALFNDAATGIYALPSTTEAASPTGSWALPAAGYYGARTDQGEYVIIDAGPIGPDYQPGHAHADLLSFEWSLAGRRIITDTGVYDYQIGPERSYDRSTAAHSTVEIDGGNSVEVWSAFRVGRRVNPKVLEWSDHGEGFTLSAEHGGYAGWTHRRDFHWEPHRLTIVDDIRGERPGQAVGRLHLAPNAIVHAKGKSAEVDVEGVKIAVAFEGPGTLSIETGKYSPEFGLRITRPVLAYAVGPTASCRWSTTLHRIST